MYETLRCVKCSTPLLYQPEQDRGDWILRCVCGAKNIIVATCEIVGWRD
jgi:hypothetical protein